MRKKESFFVGARSVTPSDRNASHYTLEATLDDRRDAIPTGVVSGDSPSPMGRSISIGLSLLPLPSLLLPILGKRQKGKLKNLFPFFLLPFSFLVSPLSALAGSASFGVVRSGDNATQWVGITTRLNQSGIPYCVVDLQNVQKSADLNGPTVLFLPNVESLTQEQAIALSEWMKKGGRLIASGPVGNLSPPDVRQTLRGVLGAYWAFPLSQPSSLKPKTQTHQKKTQATLRGTIHGGVVIPTALSSQTAATWSISDNPPAVVTTNRTTFFGWRWGVDSVASPQIDLAWLQTALNRYGVKAGTTSSQNGNCLPPVASPLAAAPTPGWGAGGLGCGGGGVQGSSGAGGQGSRGAGGNISALPRPSVPSRQTPVVPLPLPRPSPSSPVTSRQDPTERVATAAIRVAPGAETIAPQEAIAMRQELENLINRVESALLTANAADSTRIIAGVQGSRGAGENISASPASSSSTVAATSPLSTKESAANILQKAREVLQALPELVAKRDYAAARSQWLLARQSLWNLYPTDKLIDRSEIRAIWLDRGSIVQAGSEQGLAKIFDRLAQAGINTVFFETVNAGYPIYPSQVAPEQNPLTKGWDPLAAAVKLAHERGMELHAWVWTFAIGNQRHNTILNQPPNYLGPVLAAHPDWANYDNQGNIIPPGQTKPFLDPANPEVRRYLLKLLDEIVTRYKVDGLQLDYIRYPFQDPSRGAIYGYGGAARQQFQQLTGVDPLNISPRDSNLWQKWTEFRTNQINSFVAEASQMLRQRRSNLILSAAVFGYPEAERIQMLQQNWEVWARRGDVDLIVPMAYAQDTNRFQQIAQPLLTDRNLGSTLVLPGILLLNLPEVGAIDQIQLVRDLSNGGYSLFAMEHLSNTLQSIFSRTQGTVQRDAKEPIPFRKPFDAAATRFAVLQREWNFLLGTNQLILNESARSAYNTQGSELSTVLNRLAKEPNTNNLEAARRSLTAFRSQFSNWMRSHSMKNPYQVQTWENRLVSLEKLLNYGERVVLNKQPASTTQRQ